MGQGHPELNAETPEPFSADTFSEMISDFGSSLISTSPLSNPYTPTMGSKPLAARKSGPELGIPRVGTQIQSGKNLFFSWIKAQKWDG